MSATSTVQRLKISTDDLLPEKFAPSSDVSNQPPVKYVWTNIILFFYLHVMSLYAVYLMITSAMVKTTLTAFLFYQIGGIGVTAGAHRLWAHRAYKAKWPLRLFLIICNSVACQNDVLEWSRDHRMHHKFSETDADPHNAKRGFFFSHIGWLLVRKHPSVKEYGHKIDLSDLTADPFVMFQRKYFFPCVVLCCFVIPTWIPCYFWGESFLNSFLVAGLLKYCITLNATWMVNSAAHMWGNKPYDRYINPAENKGVSMFALGEGFHNYHHTFPWDYKTAELGRYSFNYTTAFIDFCAWLGLAYDLKIVDEKLIEKRVMRTGDGSHTVYGK